MQLIQAQAADVSRKALGVAFSISNALEAREAKILRRCRPSFLFPSPHRVRRVTSPPNHAKNVDPLSGWWGARVISEFAATKTEYPCGPDRAG